MPSRPIAALLVLAAVGASQGTTAAPTLSPPALATLALATPGPMQVQVLPVSETSPAIHGVQNASAAIVWGAVTILIDPVGAQAQYARFGSPDIVVLTRRHPDHLGIDTMIGMLRRDTVVLAPQSVIDRLPLIISNNTITPFAPGNVQVIDGITFTAIGATGPDANGVGAVIEADGTRLYVSGATRASPAMRGLRDIDAALVSLDPEAGMAPQDAADAVAALSPRIVIPYHHRGPTGLTSVAVFEQRLAERARAVRVERLNWN